MCTMHVEGLQLRNSARTTRYPEYDSRPFLKVCDTAHCSAYSTNAAARRARARRHARYSPLKLSVCHPGFTHSPLRRTKISVARPELTTRLPFSSVSTTYDVQIIATSPKRWMSVRGNSRRTNFPPLA